MLDNLPPLIRNVQDLMLLVKDLQNLLHSPNLNDSDKVEQMKKRFVEYSKSKTHKPEDM